MKNCKGQYCPISLFTQEQLKNKKFKSDVCVCSIDGKIKRNTDECPYTEQQIEEELPF